MKIDKEEKRYQHKARVDRVVRWDNYRISQFSYTNNLLIGLNLAFIGFFITQSGFKFRCNCYFFILQVFTGLFLIASFLTGLLTVLNRLEDFRITAQLTRKRKKKFENENNIKSYSNFDTINAKIRALKLETDKLGKRTWIFLQWQIWTFLIGTIIGVFYLIIERNVNGL